MIRVIVGAAVGVLAFVAASAPGASASAAVTWHGVTLGQPAGALRQSIGDPLRIVISPDGQTRVARFWLPPLKLTYFLVLEKRGYVVGFEAFFHGTPDGVVGTIPADPSGIRVGDTSAAVMAAHPDLHRQITDGDTSLIGEVSPGVAADYVIRGDRVASFYWGTTIPEDQRDLPALTEPAGDSVKAALLDAQSDESNGVDWEYLYLAFHPCDGDAIWKLQSQALVKDGANFYDRLHVVCPSSKAERDFFFNIERFFGKL